jgi:hypothetical protein
MAFSMMIGTRLCFGCLHSSILFFCSSLLPLLSWEVAAMDKGISESPDHLDTVESCHSHIQALLARIERLELAAELNPVRGDRPYKVLGFHCARGLSRDDGFGVYAEFLALPEAVAYCRQQIDEQIAHAIAEVENGLLTTQQQIDDAIAELMHTGWCFWVSNVADPAAGEAFDSLVYAHKRLTESLLRGARASDIKPFLGNLPDR